MKPGDSVKAEDSLVTLESDKATMDVPAPAAGVVKEVKVKVGDKVSEGSARAHARCSASGTRSARRTGSPRPQRAAPPPPPAQAAPAPSQTAAAAACRPAPAERAGVRDAAAFTAAHASPSVRKFARELGVDLAKVNGHRAERRASPQEDVQEFVKGVMTSGARRPPRSGARARPAAVAEGRLREVRADRDACRCRGSRRSPAPTSRATG